MAKSVRQFETPFDTYTTSSVLGEGGAGRVYLAKNQSGEEVAVKYLDSERISSERLKRFKNEVNFCQTTSHPNIVKVLDTGFELSSGKKCPFYVMPRYSGTLRSLIGKLDGEAILKAFAQILDGVEAAHLMGVWHRDLKPENILYNISGDNLAIADFGIAHFEEDLLYTAVETKESSRLANFQYSAPEQRIRGRKVTERADIFALGLILNEMFTQDILQGSGHAKIGDKNANFSYLDSLVEELTQQDPDKRLSISELKKQLIGRKNEFIALQEYNKSKNEVVKSTDIPQFIPIEIAAADYLDGILSLTLNRNPPPDWVTTFQNPRDYSWTMGFEVKNYQIHRNFLRFRLHYENEAQTAIDHAKMYISKANSAYHSLLITKAREWDQQQRKDLQRKTQEAEKRKNILNNLKI